jgi:hypothetical protein
MELSGAIGMPFADVDSPPKRHLGVITVGGDQIAVFVIGTLVNDRVLLVSAAELGDHGFEVLEILGAGVSAIIHQKRIFLKSLKVVGYFIPVNEPTTNGYVAEIMNSEISLIASRAGLDSLHQPAYPGKVVTRKRGCGFGT